MLHYHQRHTDNWCLLFGDSDNLTRRIISINQSIAVRGVHKPTKNRFSVTYQTTLSNKMTRRYRKAENMSKTLASWEAPPTKQVTRPTTNGSRVHRGVFTTMKYEKINFTIIFIMNRINARRLAARYAIIILEATINLLWP